MLYKRLACLGGAVLFLAAAGPADLSVADAKARGWQRLDRAQMLSLLGERLVVERADAVLEFRFSRDGQLNATATYANGFRGDGSGTWRIAEDGRLCAQIAWPRTPDNFCRPAFRLGDEVYFFRGNDDAARSIYRVRP